MKIREFRVTAKEFYFTVNAMIISANAPFFSRQVYVNWAIIIDIYIDDPAHHRDCENLDGKGARAR